MVVVDDDPDLRLARIVESWGVPHIHRSAHLGDGLAEAGLDRALAVICAETNELATLEIALRVREARPDVRLVVQLANPSVGRALRAGDRAGQRARRGRPGRPVVRRGLPRPALPRASSSAASASPWSRSPCSEDEGYNPTFRSHFGNLAPVAVMPGRRRRDGLLPGPRPSRWPPGTGWRCSGTPDELDRSGVDVARAVAAAPGVGAAAPAGSGGGCAALMQSNAKGLRLRPGRPARPGRGGHRRHPPRLRRPRHPRAISTCWPPPTSPSRRWPRSGFGDYSFAAQSAWLQVFAIALIVVGVTLVTTSFALFTNILVSRRIEQSLGRRRVPGMAGHVVVVGLGSVGIRVVEGLLAEGRRVVVVERDDNNRYLGRARALGVPVVIADATQRQTHATVNLADASAVAILTSADLTNIETGLAVRESLGDRWERGAGGAAGLRPGPGPHDGAELRVPPRPVDLGPGRPVVRGRRPRPRRPRDLLRRPAAVPGRPAADRPRRRARGPGHAGPLGPHPGDRPRRASGDGVLEHPPRRGTRFAGRRRGLPARALRGAAPGAAARPADRHGRPTDTRRRRRTPEPV